MTNKRNDIIPVFFSLALFLTMALVAFPSLSSNMSTAGFMHPLGHKDVPIQQNPGQLFDPIYGIIRHETETILDLSQEASDKKVPIYAPYAGRILHIEKIKGKGQLLSILHRDGSKTTFYPVVISPDIHFRKLYKKGDIIAHFQSTKKNNGQLHYELVDEKGYSIRQKLKTREQNEQNFVLSKRNVSFAFYNTDPFNKNSGNNSAPIAPWGSKNTKNSDTVAPQNNQAHTEKAPNSLSQSQNNPSITPLNLNRPRFVRPDSSRTLENLQATANNRSSTRAQSSDSPLCNAPVMDNLLDETEVTLDRLEGMLDVAVSDPPLVHDLSCFDQFSVDMSINVPQVGVSGQPLNIFGLDFNVDELIQMGIDSLSDGNCREPQFYLDLVRNVPFPKDIYYTSKSGNFVVGSASENNKETQYGENILPIPSLFKVGALNMIQGIDPQTGHYIIKPNKTIKNDVIKIDKNKKLNIAVHGQITSVRRGI